MINKEIISIRQYDGLVKARGALKRAIKHTHDKRLAKKLSKMHKYIAKLVNKLRG